mgnify:CR=1 FL=1
MLPALIEGIGLHDSTSSAAVGVIVHLFLLIFCIIPDLVTVDADIAPLLSPP